MTNISPQKEDISIPRVLVVTSCTGEKRYKPDHQLTFSDFQAKDQLEKRSESLSDFCIPATQMYTGQQHRLVSEGVQLLRKALGEDRVDVSILSAAYGLIEENHPIVPYEVTFNRMKAAEIDEWGQCLGIHEAFEMAIAQYDLVFVLLGKNYLRTLSLPVQTQSHQSLVFLTSPSSQKYIDGGSANTVTIPLSNQDAKNFCCPLIGLKGFLLKNLAESALRDSTIISQIYHQPSTFTDFVSPDAIQLEINLGIPNSKPPKKRKSKAKFKRYVKDEEIPIPTEFYPAPNIHLGMQYFIPEWDDRVDPNYDFLEDQLTVGRNPYEDYYAHEIYEKANYDGILVSKTVIEKSKKKREAIEQAGNIHTFLRFRGKIMGDCGAFSYLKEDVPPYSTDEILDYYERNRFDYGVSIDHLIVGPFAAPEIREKRYDLTLENAQEFMKFHRERGYQFTPIGAAQGWSPESYANAVKEIIGMGYNYVGLGGLARAQTGEILEVLKAVYAHLTDHTRLHLFGVARLNAIPAFRHLGVTSFDSASALRKAWLDSDANYRGATKDYAAVRIPEVKKTATLIKQISEAGIAEVETLERLQQEAITAMRKFDLGHCSLEETLEKILAYDELLVKPEEDGSVNLDKKKRRIEKHKVLYQELLAEQPWKQCSCQICQEVGIEVVIFRNNNRNRRRGFHNTYVFYKQFQELLDKLHQEESQSEANADCANQPQPTHIAIPRSC